MNSIWSYLKNPFNYLAGMQSIILGILVLSLSALGAYFTNSSFDGFLDYHLVERSFLNNIFHQIINFFSIFIPLLISAFIFRKEFRLVDLAGTLMIARFPFLLLLLAGLFIDAEKLNEILTSGQPNLESFSSDIILSLIIFGVIGLFALILFIYYTFKAFTTSTNAKGGLAVFLFIMSCLIAEFISLYVIRNYF